MTVKVKDCGYVVGAVDNYPAVQAAIYMAQSTDDKVVEFPGGTTNVLQELTNYDNLTFVGCSVPKHYWNQGNVDVFAAGNSIVKGNGTKPLFSLPSGSHHVMVKDLSFQDFTKICEPMTPRQFDFERCSFKNMNVLNAPANEPPKYQNFKFYFCAFTSYGSSIPFQGRIEDSEWFGNIFVGSKGFDLNQGKANKIFKNRFEWIDGNAAISMYDCSDVKIKHNWFDRVAGVAIQLKQKNKNIPITNNEFKRCGGLVSSGGAVQTYGEQFKAFFNIYGDQNGNIKIDDNLFMADRIKDDTTSDFAPKYVIGLEPNGNTTQRKFSFKNNRYHDGLGYIDSLIYGDVANYPWLTANTVIDTEAVFDHLSNAVVDLAKWSSNKLIAYNTKAVTVKEIPENLIVNNTNNAEITITPGKQIGVVFGGKVNGFRRFGKLEQLYENLTSYTVNGGSITTGNKVQYTVPVSKALNGAPIFMAANYRSYGSPDLIVEVYDEAGTTLLAGGTLTSLEQTVGIQKMYTVKFVLPVDYTGASIKINIYAAKTVVNSSSNVITIDAFCATFGDWITRGVIDENNV